MDVASAHSATRSPYLAELDEDARRRNTRIPSGSRGDAVSFSEEALALAADLAAGKDVERNRQASAFERNPGDAAEEEGGLTFGEPGAANAGIGASVSDIDAQIEKLKAQIQQLAQRMGAVMSGTGSPEEKNARSTALEERINALEQQMQELQAQQAELAKKAATSA